MIAQTITSPGILTMVYPLLVFGYAVMKSPKSDQGFWTFIIIYTAILMMAEFVISFDFWHDMGFFKADEL